MAFGIRPAYHLKGGLVRANGYKIDPGYTTALFMGDPVLLATDGTIQIANPGSNTRNLGCFWGVQYTKSDGEIVYSKTWPSGGVSGARDVSAFVYDDPETVFKIEADQEGTALGQSSIGGSFDAASGAGNPLTGISGWFLDSSGTVGATAAQMKIVASAEQDRDFTGVGTPMDFFVTFNEHVWTNESAGVA